MILALDPVGIALLEIIFLRTQQLSLRLAAGLLLGILGVAVLVDPWASLAETALDRASIVAWLLAYGLVGIIITPSPDAAFGQSYERGYQDASRQSPAARALGIGRAVEAFSKARLISPG